jgi:hypothetical protein
MNVNLIKGDKIDANVDYRDALPVNMYAVKKEILGAKGYMLACPGITQFGTGSGVDRGAIYNERLEKQFRVSGSELISVGSDGATTTLGGISGIKQAAMPYSFNTQAIIVDGKMWLYSSGLLTQVTASGIGAPIDGTWIDGYYFLTDGENLYHTELTNEAAVNGLSYATAEFMPDNSLGVGKTQDNKVIVFGRYTLEYFVNVATDNFAFKRLETRAQKIGIVATHAKCEAAGDWYIVGGRKEEALGVHIVGASTVRKISTREIDKLLSRYTETDLSDIRVEARKEDGTTLVIVHLPYETLCFNREIAEEFGIEYAWTRLQSGVQVEGAYIGINCVVDPRNGKFVLGSRTTSNIGHLDDSTFAQFGDIQEAVIYSPFVNLETKSVDEIRLETIAGRNTINDAKVFVSMSKHGDIFGQEYSMAYGAPHDYQKKFIMRRMGYVDSWAGFKFRAATKSRLSFASFDVQAT